MECVLLIFCFCQVTKYFDVSLGIYWVIRHVLFLYISGAFQILVLRLEILKLICLCTNLICNFIRFYAWITFLSLHCSTEILLAIIIIIKVFLFTNPRSTCCNIRSLDYASHAAYLFFESNYFSLQYLIFFLLFIQHKLQFCYSKLFINFSFVCNFFGALAKS